jgi:hypothetical protein
MYRNMLTLFTCCMALLTFFQPLRAQVVPAPGLINFQGRLSKPDGTPLPDGPYSIRFSLWDAESSGNELWSQTLPTIMVKNGVFATLLNVGATPGLFDGNRWLEIKVGSDAPLAPRQPLVSVAYAMKANSVPDGSINTTQLANDAVTAAKIISNAVGAAKLASEAASLLKVSGNVLTSSGGNIGVNNATPGFPLNFSATLGDKISLWGNSGAHYGFGVQSNLLQIHADVSASDIAFGYGSSTSFTERMRIRGNGNVGIGTASPAARLDVNGGVNIRGANQLELGSDVAGKELNAGTISYQHFTPDSLEIVGAGTSGTNRKITMYAEGGLNMQGRVFLPNGTIQNGTTPITTTTDLGLYSQVANKWMRLVTRNGDIRFFTDGGIGTNARMIIHADGRIGIARAAYSNVNVTIGDTGLDYSLAADGRVLAQSYGTISDARFKKNIAVYPNALETVLRLRGVTYDWRKEEFPDKNFQSGKQIGFIAQELEQVLPELVFTASTGYKSVNYTHVIPVLVEAIKAQQKQLEAKEQRLNTLEKEVAELKVLLVQLAQKRP